MFVEILIGEVFFECGLICYSFGNERCVLGVRLG